MNVKHLAVATAIVLGTAGVVGSASASDISIPFDFSFGAGTNTLPFTFTVQPSSELVNINVIASWPTATAMSFQLYSGPSDSGPTVGTVATGTVLPPLHGIAASEDYASGPGVYTVAVTETVGAPDTGAAGGTLTISSVPLPGALPLFGAGLVGLGAYGWRRSRKSRLASI